MFLLIRQRLSATTVTEKGILLENARSGRNQGRKSYGDNGRSNAPTNESSSQALMAQYGLGGYDWSNDFEVEPANYALMAISYSSSSSSFDNGGNFLTPRADISFAGLDEYAIRNKIIESQTTELNTKTSETAGQTNDANTKKPKSANDEEEVNEVQTVRPETQTVKTRDDKSGQNSQKQGISFRKVKACFVCKSTEHLIKDCNFHDKKSQEPKLKNVVNTGQREGKPVWDNTKRVNHQNFSKYPHLSKTFVPSGVLTRTGLHRPSVSTARPICTARPSISTTRPSCRVQNMTTVGTRAVVNTSKGKMDTDLKKSRWFWRPKGNYLDHVSKDSRSFMLKKGNPKILLHDHAVVDSGCSSHMIGNKAYLSDYEDYNGGFMAFGSNPKRGKITGKGKIRTANLDFDDVYFVDELNFKLLDESQVVLRASRKDEVYNLDLMNIVPSGGITCLYANATSDESKLWHRRLGHVNFKNINKLVKGHLVRGLPSKVFMNDYTCVACKKGKQHKASCKAKLDRTIRKPLELLHMDLFGPVSVDNINKKRYCLVMTDDFSRFSCVFFLATKYETSKILCKFIIGLENQLNHKVKIIRCANRIEFKNYTMNELCAKKGIKREFSVARTPQQNGVAERKNRTLIEAARTMLADSLLPILFWAEAVNTACYVLNRVLVTKPQNKTPYELLIGKPPSISFMRPFGCPLTILNTLDSLGKFDGKSDEGYLLGYSTTSKAFRVYNKRTKRVEENLHIDFLEDQPNVAGTGPDWMFDLDFLTNTMNYIPVSVENQVTVDAGTQESYVAGSSGKDKETTQEYILLPVHPHRTRSLVEAVVPVTNNTPRNLIVILTSTCKILVLLITCPICLH
ncbi:putative ribonuclease H-like domain-containing protein [Tanacetum coccineum]